MSRASPSRPLCTVWISRIQANGRRRRGLIKSLAGEISGVISTQVIQEFYVAATGKLGADPLLIKDILRSLERFETVLVSPMLIKEAIDCTIINVKPTSAELITYFLTSVPLYFFLEKSYSFLIEISLRKSGLPTYTIFTL